MGRCKNCGRSLGEREGVFIGYGEYCCCDRCAEEWREREEKKEKNWVKAHPTLASIRTKIRITIVVAFILFLIYCYFSGKK